MGKDYPAQQVVIETILQAAAKIEGGITFVDVEKKNSVRTYKAHRMLVKILGFETYFTISSEISFYREGGFLGIDPDDGHQFSEGGTVTRFTEHENLWLSNILDRNVARRLYVPTMGSYYGTNDGYFREKVLKFYEACVKFLEGYVEAEKAEAEEQKKEQASMEPATEEQLKGLLDLFS